jgi:hypothetical protein
MKIPIRFPFDEVPLDAGARYSIYSVADNHGTVLLSRSTGLHDGWHVDKKGLLIESDGETQLAVFDGVRLYGDVPVLAGHGENDSELLLAPSVQLGDRWEIAISTYPEGRRISLPRIIASLGAVSRPVTVIVSGVPIADGFDYSEGNVRYVSEHRDTRGMSGVLAASSTGSDYILLLHDTCVALEGFESRISSLDVGLLPQMAYPAPLYQDKAYSPVCSEIALYRRDYALELDHLTSLPMAQRYTGALLAARCVAMPTPVCIGKAAESYGDRKPRNPIAMVAWGIEKRLRTKAR